MVDRNQQFDACRRAIDQFVRQAIVVRTRLAENERTAKEAMETLASAKLSPEQAKALQDFRQAFRVQFGLSALQTEMKLKQMLAQAENMAALFTGPSGRYLRRHIHRMRDQVEAIKADSERIKHWLAEVGQAESPASR